MIKALIKLVFGIGLCAGGIALECMWLAFCFGTIVVGIVLLLWFPPILLFPFTFLSIPGWRLVKDGLAGINPPNLGRIATQIAPIIQAQLSEIELKGNTVRLDAQVLTYIGAMAIAAGNRNLSLNDVISITSGFYPSPNYKHSVANLRFCVDYSDGLKGFWAGVASMVPVARGELAAGQGTTLVRLSAKRE